MTVTGLCCFVHQGCGPNAYRMYVFALQKLGDLEPFGVDRVPHLIAVDADGKVKESPCGDPFHLLKLTR